MTDNKADLRIAWIDPDVEHARRAQLLLGLGDNDWWFTQAERPTAPAPGQPGWSAVVLCLPEADTALPDWAMQAAPPALLLCLWPGQEGLAARALRTPGSCADYLLRQPGQDHVPELFERLKALLQRSAAHQAPQQQLQQLQQQVARMQTALGSMSQGIFQTTPEGRVNVYNQRVLEILNLPESLMASQPTLAQLTHLQNQRGDFGQACNLVDDRARAYIQGGAVQASPDTYWRRTRDGRTLEVRTRSLPDGGLVRTFADISDHVRAQTELRLSEERFRSLCNLSSDWYWEQDAQFRFTDIAGLAAQQDARLRALLGQALWDVETANMEDADWDAHRQLLAAQQPFRELELKRLGPDGSVMWLSLSGEPIVSPHGLLLGYRGVGRNITERKRVEGEIERLAFYDALTGLPNRRLLLDRLQRCCVTLERSKRHAGLLFIDLDNFKDLNDSRGHDLGDQLLAQVAQRLRQCVRASDTVARFGGDEFIVLAEAMSFAQPQARLDAQRLALKIADALSKPYVLGDGLAYHSTPSIGVTVFGHPALTPEELLRQADFAMYQAKAAGRNVVRFFDPGLLAQMRARAELETELRQGLTERQLLLHYQPVVDGQGQIIAAEALVRWHHPTRGLVPPGDFIPLAEQTGLILPLGLWVLETACAQLAAWARQPQLQHLTLSVNVSARQFRQSEFAEQVQKTLQASGARPGQLRLELTESLLLTDTEETIAKMDYLRALGVRFSLDDFGTGYSSLSYLKRLPLDQLKIDRGFVRDVLTDPNDAAIVRTILALAHSLDLGAVAEGVENQSQLDFLRQSGCTTFQGFLFARPGPADMLERAIQAAA